MAGATEVKTEAAEDPTGEIGAPRQTFQFQGF